MPSFEFFLPLYAIIAVALLCWLVRRVLLKTNTLDIPNDRSMHAVPVPRGGGIALWLAVIPAWIGVLIIGGTFLPQAPALIGFALLAVVSWMDDRKALPARIRFGAQVIAVVLTLAFLPTGQLVFGGTLPLWLDRIIAAFCWLWFINLTNFMDGIDGITGVESVHICFGFAVIALLTALPLRPEIYLALLLVGGLMGFLFWNWNPAKLFLGDVGSVPLGFLMGYILIKLGASGYLPAALILPLYYVADASLTLGYRMLYGFKFWEAHRTHFYQRAALKVGPKRVVALIMLANIALFGISIVSLGHGFIPGLAGALLVAGLLWYLNRLANRA